MRIVRKKKDSASQSNDAQKKPVQSNRILYLMKKIENCTGTWEFYNSFEKS